MTAPHDVAASDPLVAALRSCGLDDPARWFDHPQVVVWRSLSDRENATLDLALADGSGARLHVKRYPSGAAGPEIAGHRLLVAAGIPTADLVAGAVLPDGSSYVAFRDLAGYTPADKLVAAGTPFNALLDPTANLAAKLHTAGLHHRDLYLCHFMANPSTGDVRLIDVARVRRLPGLFTRRRWVVKDLAQFWYSTQSLPVADALRDAWLRRYCDRAGVRFDSLKGPIVRKARAIARHDAKLRQAQPTRNISIPR